MKNTSKRKPSTSLLAASHEDHANLFQQQEIERERMTIVTSGRRCLDLYGKYVRLGSLARMLVASSRWKMARHLKGYALIWKAKGTKYNRIILELQVSGRATEECGYGLLPAVRANGHEGWETRKDRKGEKVPESYLESLVEKPQFKETYSGFLPTPNTMDHMGQRSEAALIHQATTTRKGRTAPSNLREAVNPRAREIYEATSKGFLPTPTSTDYKGTYTEEALTSKDGIDRSSLLRTIGHQTGAPKEQLSPEFTEWLMGFPIGWTNLQDPPPPKPKEEQQG